MKKQLTMSLISDELGQASTKKKEFLGIMEKLIPWSEWVGIVQPHYYKGERGNKPYDLELMLRIYVLQHLFIIPLSRPFGCSFFVRDCLKVYHRRIPLP